MITIAIPYYKNRDYLHRALRSVMAQAHREWRVLVCDDAGDPEVEKIVQSFGDFRFQYHRNPGRLGMVANWNQCLDLAESEFVTILHADDELLPNYVEIMHRGMQSFPDATLLFCRAQIINEKSQRVFSFPDFFKISLMPSLSEAFRLCGDSGIRRLLRGNFIFCPTVCYRKSTLGSRRFSPKWKMVQDLELWIRLLLRGDELIGLPEKAYSYRRHPNNATEEYTRNLLRFKEEALFYDEISKTLSQVGSNRAARVARRAIIIKLNVAYCLLKDVLGRQWSAAGAKFDLLLKMR